MAETFKEFEALYKKCKPITKGAAKDATIYAKRLKYFRHDMNNALDELEEKVLEEKCSEEPIKASKIEDYCKNKEMAALYKAVQWNLDKILEAYKDLDKMESSAGFGKPNLKNLLSLQDEIIKAANLKKKNKLGKLDANILKLENQVNDDLQQIMDFWDALDQITANRRDDPQKEYDARIKSIMKAKPRLSAKTKKYLELAPKMLNKKALQRALNQCQLVAKAVNDAAKKAVIAASKQDNKGLMDNITAGDKQIKLIEKIEGDYSKIMKKYDTEISKSEGKKAIEKAMTKMEKIKSEIDKRWESAKTEISNIKKAESKKV